MRYFKDIGLDEISYKLDGRIWYIRMACGWEQAYSETVKTIKENIENKHIIEETELGNIFLEQL